eukprot:gene8326-5837_t
MCIAEGANTKQNDSMARETYGPNYHGSRKGIINREKEEEEEKEGIVLQGYFFLFAFVVSANCTSCYRHLFALCSQAEGMEWERQDLRLVGTTALSLTLRVPSHYSRKHACVPYEANAYTCIHGRDHHMGRGHHLDGCGAPWSDGHRLMFIQA